MIAPGQIVDRYEVLNVLGEGGMARVYAIRHRELGSEHALKVLTVYGRDVRERLVAEGKIQATLRHPNIVTVTDLVDCGGFPGLVMERVRGPSLDLLLATRRLRRDEVESLARGILAGVSAAHAYGLVHRDLKPGNILLDQVDADFVPKIADFGLARVLESEGQRTRTGSTMGTPSYMAPEQFRNAKHAGPEADVFALGAVLYECCTGRRAFDGDDLIAVYEAMIAERYEDPLAIQPDLPVRWVNAIRMALIPDRIRRVQTVAALRALWDGVEVPLVTPKTWVDEGATPTGAPSTIAPERQSLSGSLLWMGALGGVGALGVAAAIILVLGTLLIGLLWKGPDPWSDAEPDAAPVATPVVPEPVVAAPPETVATQPPLPKPRVQAPRPVTHEPEPETVVAPPTPLPTPTPAPAVRNEGFVEVDGRVPVRLRDSSGVNAAVPGRVPSGQWTVMAD